MQYRIRLIIIIALVAALAFTYYQLEDYRNLASKLLTENIQLKENKNIKDPEIKETDSDLRKKVKILEKENKLLKKQIFKLEKQQLLFKPNQNDEIQYELNENLNFKDETKNLELKDDNLENKKKEDYTITPSIDFNKEKKEIEGVKLQVETTF